MRIEREGGEGSCVKGTARQGRERKKFLPVRHGIVASLVCSPAFFFAAKPTCGGSYPNCPSDFTAVDPSTICAACNQSECCTGGPPPPPALLAPHMQKVIPGLPFCFCLLIAACWALQGCPPPRHRLLPLTLAGLCCCYSIMTCGFLLRYLFCSQPAVWQLFLPRWLHRTERNHDLLLADLHLGRLLCRYTLNFIILSLCCSRFSVWA